MTNLTIATTGIISPIFHVKKLFIFVILIFLTAQTSLAQKNELYISYGWGSGPFIISAIRHTLNTNSSTQSLRKTGTIGIGYDRYLSTQLAIGLHGTVEIYDNKEFIGLMLKMKYDWISKDTFHFYSSIAGGLGLEDFPNPVYVPAFQVSPVGIRVGKNFGIFTELGLGWSGGIIVGLSGKF